MARADEGDWLRAVVPGAVLTTLVWLNGRRLGEVRGALIPVTPAR